MNTPVLILSPYYYPGVDAGGPVKSLKNLSKLLLRQGRAVRVITKDRDVGAKAAFPGLVTDRWNATDYGIVYYASSLAGTLRSFRKEGGAAYSGAPIVYLNSFFSFRFSILPVVIIRFGWVSRVRLIVAPRGEFALGALGNKPLRKRVFLWLARRFGLYGKVLWHATNDEEASRIRTIFGARAEVRVAGNLSGDADGPPQTFPPKSPGEAALVFVARMVRIKNLHFALQTLSGMKARVRFDLYGPQEDPGYWAECRKIIAALPENVSVRWLGVLDNKQICEVLAGYDLFYMPTQGENFGHSIVEALQAGCPVLISDQTPWRDLEAAGAGWDLPLDHPEAFAAAVEAIAAMDSEEREAARGCAKEYVAGHVLLRESEARNLDLFA